MPERHVEWYHVWATIFLSCYSGSFFSILYLISLLSTCRDVDMILSYPLSTCLDLDFILPSSSATRLDLDFIKASQMRSPDYHLHQQQPPPLPSQQQCQQQQQQQQQAEEEEPLARRTSSRSQSRVRYIANRAKQAQERQRLQGLAQGRSGSIGSPIGERGNPEGACCVARSPCTSHDPLGQLAGLRTPVPRPLSAPPDPDNKEVFFMLKL